MNEQIPFSEIERLAKIALDSGDLSRLQDLLVPLCDDNEKSRSAAENLFLHRTLGKAYQELEKDDDALASFEKAYSYDPRDFDALKALVDRELLKDADKSNSGLMMDFLIFHRHVLKDDVVMRIFKRIGDAYLSGNELAQARECYEKALDAKPGEPDLINALLKVSEASGDEEAIAKSRKALLDSMTAPESRAAIYVTIGDDCLNRKNDESAAIAMYEEALSECAASTSAHQRILVIAEKNEDWDRCLNSLRSLVNNSSDNDEKCKYLLKMAAIFKEKLGNSKRAIALFNDVLDINPNDLEVFKNLITLLQAQNDLKGIEANYVRMIKRHQDIDPMDTKLVAGLSKNLADLRLKQLNDLAGSASAYQLVSDLYPDNVNVHVVLAKLYANMDDTIEKAIHENREILRLAPDHLDAVSQLAVCYRKLGKYDEALCMYRVLAVLGISDPEGDAIVHKFAEQDLPSIDTPLSDDLWKLIMPKTLDITLLQIFKTVCPIIAEHFAESPETYGFKEKEARIDLNDNSTIVNTLRRETTSLRFAEIPNIYKCDKYKGFTNAFFSSLSLLVNSNFLKSRSDRELAFASSKALIMLRPEFYLMPLGLASLQLILQLIFKCMDPSLNVKLDKNSERVQKTLDKGLTEEKRNFIKERIQDLNKRGKKIDLRLFYESVEDLGNRIGLLFCDDPSIIRRLLAEERTISTRSAQDRVGSLLLWALSEDYLTLRQKLGIALKAS